MKKNFAYLLSRYMYSSSRRTIIFRVDISLRQSKTVHWSRFSIVVDVNWSNNCVDALLTKVNYSLFHESLEWFVPLWTLIASRTTPLTAGPELITWQQYHYFQISRKTKFLNHTYSKQKTNFFADFVSHAPVAIFSEIKKLCSSDRKLL